MKKEKIVIEGIDHDVMVIEADEAEKRIEGKPTHVPNGPEAKECPV